jgi:hypothetical protein
MGTNVSEEPAAFIFKLTSALKKKAAGSSNIVVQSTKLPHVTSQKTVTSILVTIRT